MATTSAAAFFSPSELNGAGFSASELKGAGLNAKGCCEAGAKATELLELGFVIEDVQRALYGGRSVSELRRSGVSSRELADAGFSANELNSAGFSVSDLKCAGFSAAYIGPFFCTRLTRDNAVGKEGQEVISEGKFGVITEVSDRGSAGVWNFVKITYEDGSVNRDDKAGYIRLHVTPVYLTAG